MGAQHIMSIGKSSHNLDELLDIWEILENRYYWVDWLKARKHFRKVNKDRKLTEEDFPDNISLKSRLSKIDFYIYRPAVQHLFESSVKFFLLFSQASNKMLNPDKNKHQILQFMVDTTNFFQKNILKKPFIDSNNYPPYGWHLLIKDEKISDQEVFEVYHLDFESRI